MFEFSKIDKELTVYRENDVIVFGASKSGLNVKHLLERHGVKIAAFADNGINKVVNSIEGINIISFDECIKYIHKHKNVIVQIGSVFEREIAEQFKSRGIECYIWYSEFIDRMRALNRYKFCQKFPNMKEDLDEIEWQNWFYGYGTNMKESLLSGFQYNGKVRLMLSAPKVGNVTILNSLLRRGENLIFAPHSYNYIDVTTWKLLSQYPVKLIIGVRDPIKQNVSVMYQMLTTDIVDSSSYYDIEEYWHGGGDIKSIFNEYVIKNDKECYLTRRGRRRHCDSLVQHFFEQQIEPFFGVDVYQYPFDKEKGFSIYHINAKLSIMIYQLEKLSDLGRQIGDFFEIENLNMETGNESANKWYSENYSNVIRNMPINRQYYEESYSSKYIRHFYNEKDIERFKAFWKVDEG